MPIFFRFQQSGRPPSNRPGGSGRFPVQRGGGQSNVQNNYHEQRLRTPYNNQSSNEQWGTGPWGWYMRIGCYKVFEDVADDNYFEHYFDLRLSKLIMLLDPPGWLDGGQPDCRNLKIFGQFCFIICTDY